MSAQACADRSPGGRPIGRPRALYPLSLWGNGAHCAVGYTVRHTSNQPLSMVRKANPALLKPMNLSADLEAVVGKGPMARGQGVKKLWEHTKKHENTNPQNKRTTLADKEC